MADVFAVFGTLLALGIAFPGLLTTFRLLFPNPVEIAQTRVQQTPWSCFWFGAVTTILISMPIFLLIALPFGPAKLMGSILIFLALCFATIGAAGIVSLMALRVSNETSQEQPSTGSFIKAAIALELAAVFPVIGWFVILPLTIITSVGAASFAILRWRPRVKAVAVPEPLPSQA